MKTPSLALLLAIGLVATACGGTDGAETGVATLETADTFTAAGDEVGDAGEEVDTEQAMMDLAACLRDQGLDIDDPTVDSEGNVQFGGFRGLGGEAGQAPTDREALRAAMDACQDELGGVALGFGSGGFDPTELQDTMVEYAACMRENGYDMDDPDFSSFGPGAAGEPGERPRGPFAAIDPDDPDFIAAQEVCGDVLGGLPGAGGRGPRGGNG